MFLSFHDYSFPLLVSSSLFLRFICCYVLFFVSCLPMTHLHSHGAFSTLIRGTMSGRRHSIFAFFSLQLDFSLTALKTLTLTLTQLTFTQNNLLLLNKLFTYFLPINLYCLHFSVLVENRLIWTNIKRVQEEEIMYIYRLYWQNLHRIRPSNSSLLLIVKSLYCLSHLLQHPLASP
jgi:hypothetical protein